MGIVLFNPLISCAHVLLMLEFEGAAFGVEGSATRFLKDFKLNSLKSLLADSSTPDAVLASSVLRPWHDKYSASLPPCD